MRNVTRARRLLFLLIVPMLTVPIFARASRAAEPRPWLCRQIPVFSGAKSMTWRATRRGAGHWLMTFMRYAPPGGHDGFTVVSTRAVDREAGGTLDAGQWYAVALYRSGGHWICPANASQSDHSGAGAIRSLCYGEDEDSCDVKLVVGSAAAQ